MTLALAGACVLFVAAIAVRAIPPAQRVAPQDVVEETPHIVEPMQFLGSGAKLRAAELDAWISADRRGRFKALRELAFHVGGCPGTRAWLDGVEGQRFERLLGELRSGKREEAFAALALTFQLARATEWKPGIVMNTSSANVERLASLFQDWLRTWGEKSANDSLLAEPAAAAVLVYGRLMRVAQRAPVLGTSDAPYKRAQMFLGDLLGEGRSRRTALGECMQAHSSAAISRLSSADDALRGLDEEALVLFPDLTGACEK